MRKDEQQLLQLIEKVEKDQIYLLQTPQTSQQKFLHLFAHRHLVQQKMIHKNIENVLEILPGSFAQASLSLAYASLCIENQIEVHENISPLLPLINGWINFYPSIKRKNKVLFGELVLQDHESVDNINGYDLYLNYINLISVDLWKLLTKQKEEQIFYKERPFKEEIKQWETADLKHLDPVDLLTFVSSCIPKVLLNIIMEKGALPVEMREKMNKFECLFSNQQIEFYLRSGYKLSLLLKQVFLALISLELNPAQQKFLMLVAIRYYYIYHFNRRFNASEIIIYAFNKLSDEVRNSLKDEMALFIKIILKLGKQKFIAFLEKNSPFLRQIITTVNKKPTIGYSQESASPYNTIGIGQKIIIERGATTTRNFEILQQNSLVYFRIVVDNLDINVKFYYLGEISTNKQIKTLLFTHQKKSGEIKSCINAMKKGLYQFQFDNTYSWINSKTLKYQNVIYTPLELKTVGADQWIDDFFQNIYQNCIAKEEEIYVVQKRVQSKQQKLDTASLSKTEDQFSLVITKQNQSYEYQTDNPERIEQKVLNLLKSKDQYKWILMHKPASDIRQIQNFIRGVIEPKASPKAQIIQNYQEDEEENEEDQGQYEVVQRQLEQSQIFNQDKLESTRSKISARSEKEQPAQKNEKKEQKNTKVPEKKQSNKSKDQILCNMLQTEQFYSQSTK